MPNGLVVGRGRPLLWHNEQMPDTTPVFLALDVSKHKLGFASNTGLIVFGRGSTVRKRLPLDLKAVRLQVAATQATALVLGLPLRTDGKQGHSAGANASAQRVRAFGSILQQKGYSVHYQDERFSTVRARDRGFSDLDEGAAVEILEMYLMALGNI